MWFSDKSTGLPLKLHLPVGVLFDQKVIGENEEPPRAPDELISEQHHHQLPWSISVHFGNFPDTQIIKFESRWVTQLYKILRNYQHKIEALYLQGADGILLSVVYKRSRSDKARWPCCLHYAEERSQSTLAGLTKRYQKYRNEDILPFKS